MTEKEKATWYYYLGIPLMLLVIVFGSLAWQHGGFLLSLGALISLALFVGMMVLSLKSSRCPHCRKGINLAGAGAHCPQCGSWIPFKVGDLPPKSDDE